MEMVRRMDAGPIVAQREVPIEDGDTTATLTNRLARANAELLLDVLPGWLAGEIQAIPQDENAATYTKLLTKEDGEIDWSKPAVQIERDIRAFVPWPVAYTFWKNRSVRIFSAYPSNTQTSADPFPGVVVAGGPDGITVQTGVGDLTVTELQLEGSKRMAAAEFVRGHADVVGARLAAERS